MKKKKISILIIAITMVCSTLKGLPANASTSWLDVKPGDINSALTYKDTGADWEDKFYVTPTLYVGTEILGNSVSQNIHYGSGVCHLRTYARKYWYTATEAPGGIYYKLGCASEKDSNWKLEGWYTP